MNARYLPAICLAMAATIILPTHFAIADDHTMCLESDSDPDGDGYGWENGATCVVIADTSIPPVFYDLATGEQVELTLASWQKADLENKPVVCNIQSWSESAGTYVMANTGTRIYYHNPLDTAGTVRNEQIFQTHNFNSSSKKVESWNLESGTYTGPAWFDQTPYVEIVSAAGGFENAIRVWFSDNTYGVCTAFPASGTFIPTGNRPECVDTTPLGDGWGWDGEGTCRILDAANAEPGLCDVDYAPPVNECVDVFPVGDGWGWNGYYSCEL